MNGSGQWGSKVVPVRRTLQPTVLSVDTNVVDEVWLRLACLRNVLLGFAYVPLPDSQYFNPAQFSAVQERIKFARAGTVYVIMRDMNTRFGESVRNLPGLVNVSDAQLYTYPHIPDPVRTANDNARTLAIVCIDARLIIVNNFRTYNKGAEWKSELDVCVTSTNVVKCLSAFCVWQDMSLPSDHAPIALSVSPPSVDVTEQC